MAELTGKAVSELPEATNAQDSDLLAISQDATSKKVTVGTLLKGAIPNSGAGYCKMPDGTLIQWGASPIARNAGLNYATATFPIPFIDTPIGLVNYTTGHPELWIPSIPATTKTTIQCCLYNAGSTISSSAEIWWFAIGRWK